MNSRFGRALDPGDRRWCRIGILSAIFAVMPAVADGGGVDMLIGARVLLDRRDVETRLMREGGLADISGVAIGRAVQALVEET